MMQLFDGKQNAMGDGRDLPKLVKSTTSDQAQGDGQICCGHWTINKIVKYTGQASDVGRSGSVHCGWLNL